MDWTPIAVAALGGGAVGTVIGHWLNRPKAAASAAAAAEDRRELRARRRELVDMGRALANEATREGWQPRDIVQDPRWSELRGSLTESVRQRYDEARVGVVHITVSNRPHKELEEDLDRLEREWKLV